MNEQISRQRCTAEQLAVGSALYALEPAEQAYLDGHLLNCEHARRIVRESEEVAALLGTSVPQFSPPPELRERLLAKVAEPARRPAPQPPPVGPRRAGRQAPRVRLKVRISRTLVAGLVVAIAVVDVLGVQIFQGNELSQLPASSQGAQFRTPDGRAVATLVTANDAAAVVPTGLPADDSQRETYVLWGHKDNRWLPLTTFDVDEGNKVTSMSWPLHGTAYDGYAISLEHGRTTPSAPTNVVAATVQ